MATKTTKMKVHRCTENEINRFRKLMQELEYFHRYEMHHDSVQILKDFPEELPILSRLLQDTIKDPYATPSDYLDRISQVINGSRWEMILFNLDVLLDNCADMNVSHLDFNEEIRHGLELREKHIPQTNIFRITFAHGHVEWCTAKNQLHLLKSYDAEYEFSIQDIENIESINENEAKTTMVKNTEYNPDHPEDMPEQLSIWELAVGDDFCVIASTEFD